MPDAHLEAFEARLAEAVRRFCHARAAPAAAHRELEATLLRLGFAPAAVGLAVERPGSLEPAMLERMREAVARELASLSRHARAGRAGYDLNRHIAVFRARRQLAGEPSRPAQPLPPGAARRSDKARKSARTASSVAASMRR